MQRPLYTLRVPSDLADLFRSLHPKLKRKPRAALETAIAVMNRHPPRFFSASSIGVIRSIGTGNTIVEVLSPAMLLRVCR